MIEIRDSAVYEITEHQNGIEIKLICNSKKVMLSVDKPEIAADGEDVAIIAAHLETWQGEKITEAVAVTFEVNGETIEKMTNSQGETSIEFASLTPGRFPVSCYAPGFGAGSMEVVVIEE